LIAISLTDWKLDTMLLEPNCSNYRHTAYRRPFAPASIQDILLVSSPGQWMMAFALMSARDGLWEVMDQQEHEDWADQSICYEQKFGRLHKMIPSAEIIYLYNKYRRLQGTSLEKAQDEDEGNE
jgi:hypothetical protein